AVARLRRGGGEGVSALGGRGFPRPPRRRGALPFAGRAASARDRGRACGRSENPAARRAGGRLVLGRIRRDGEVSRPPRPQPRDSLDRARHGCGVRRCRPHLGAAFRRGGGDGRGRAHSGEPEGAGNLSRNRLRAMAILEVHDIHTFYGEAYVLQGLSLSLEQGQILGLLGRNGVGKTTLVNSIVGFNPPRRGRIIFKGIDISHVSSFETVRGGMGLVPQGRRVFPSLTVEENLLVAARGIERHGWNLERVYALFPRLRERRAQRARTLSGGEQQMLAIGRGLMTNPDCLIMDEPSEGLAPIIIQGLWEAIGKL